VIAETGRHVNQPAVREALALELPSALLPGRIIVLDAFPTTPSGKINRKALPAPETSGGEAAEISAAPAGKTEARLAQLWAEVLGLGAVGIHDDFFALGGHSLLGVRLFARIEDEFGRRLPLSLIFSAPTVAQLAQQIDAGADTQRSSIVATIQPGGDKPPFFCVHGFGGGVLGYGELARQLGSEQPFYGLQARGHDGREEPDKTVEAMATRYIEAMRSIQPQGPYRIGGYCYGGVVAYEMARQLEAMGEETVLVAVIEGFAPKRFQARTPTLHPRRLGIIWRSVPHWAKDYARMDREWAKQAVLYRISRRAGRAPWRADEIAGFDETGQIDLTVAAGSDLRGVPAHHQQLMRLQLEAMRQYLPEPYGGRVTLFRSGWQTVTKALFGALDPEYGWGALATGGVEIRLVDGAHRNIHMAPHVNSLAAELAEALEAVKDR
jgi:thioesterase domain-containing protein/acyl carrier protein